MVKDGVEKIKGRVYGILDFFCSFFGEHPHGIHLFVDKIRLLMEEIIF